MSNHLKKIVFVYEDEAICTFTGIEIGRGEFIRVREVSEPDYYTSGLMHTSGLARCPRHQEISMKVRAESFQWDSASHEKKFTEDEKE